MSRKFGGNAGGGGKSSKIAFQKPPEPSFLKKLKERVGYRDVNHSIQEKFQELDKEDQSDGEDEQPTIVVLKDGDLSAEEVHKIKELEKEAEEKPPKDGRIYFKKPSALKRPASTDKESDSKNATKTTTTTKTTRPSSKQAKTNSSKSLLSFDDDNDEDHIDDQ